MSDVPLPETSYRHGDADVNGGASGGGGGIIYCPCQIPIHNRIYIYIHTIIVTTRRIPRVFSRTPGS